MTALFAAVLSFQIASRALTRKHFLLPDTSGDRLKSMSALPGRFILLIGFRVSPGSKVRHPWGTDGSQFFLVSTGNLYYGL